MKQIGVLLLALLLGACSPEMYIERVFEKSIPEVSIMLVFPDELHAVNSKSGLDLNSVSDEVYDSVFYSADFLPYIWRDTFLHDFQKNLKSEFEANGFEVFNENQWSEFLSLENAAYVVNISFLQLEERYTNHTDFIYDNGKLESKWFIKEPKDVKVNLKNTLTLNAWVDFQNIHDSSNTIYSYYTFSELSDKYVSKMVKNEDQFVYQISKDSLSLAEAKTLKDTAAFEIRNNMVDFMVNQTLEQYVGVNFNRYPLYYLRFDGKGDLKSSDEAPNYIYLSGESED